MPKMNIILPFCQAVLKTHSLELTFLQDIPIGNFFSNRELFYLTHIHENRANRQSLLVLSIFRVNHANYIQLLWARNILFRPNLVYPRHYLFRLTDRVMHREHVLWQCLWKQEIQGIPKRSIIQKGFRTSSNAEMTTS